MGYVAVTLRHTSRRRSGSQFQQANSSCAAKETHSTLFVGDIIMLSPILHHLQKLPRPNATRFQRWFWPGSGCSVPPTPGNHCQSSQTQADQSWPARRGAMCKDLSVWATKREKKATPTVPQDLPCSQILKHRLFSFSTSSLRWNSVARSAKPMV